VPENTGFPVNRIFQLQFPEEKRRTKIDLRKCSFGKKFFELILLFLKCKEEEQRKGGKDLLNDFAGS
jgi:hypothetical protein